MAQGLKAEPDGDGKGIEKRKEARERERSSIGSIYLERTREQERE